VVARYLIRLPALMWVLACLVGTPVDLWAEDTKPAAPAASSKTMFYRLLAQKPAATVEDAIRALARYKGGAQELKPLAEELSFLNSQEIRFPKDIVRRKDMTLTMGSAAHMLMKAVGIKGKSIMYQMLPDQQRYAMREASEQGIIPPAAFVGQTLSGNDLLGMLVRVNEIVEAERKAAEKKDTE